MKADREQKHSVMSERRDDLGGLIAWLVIIVVVSFVATKHIWFDALKDSDKALFWTNVAVAIGTLALAGVTWWNVRQTSAVIASEDRRHQQGFAPLVELDEPGSAFDGAFSVRNIGYGLALNVSINIDGKLTFESPYEVEVPDEEADEILRAGGVITNSGGKCYKTLRKQDTERFYVGYLLSALKSDATPAPLSYDRIRELHYWKPKIEYDRVTLTYQDMFGNEYATIYETDSLQYYSWQQPRHLAIRRRSNSSPQ